MPNFEFDPGEYAGVPDDVVQDRAVDAVVAGLERSPAPQMSLDALDLEVEKRFEVAMYYRLLLKDSLFNEVTEASQVVEREVRDFIRERLEILMGLKTPKPEPVAVPSPFSDEEVEALKSVAGKILKNAKGLLGDSKPAPSLKKPQVPAATAPVAKPTPAVKRRGPVAKPKPAPAPQPKPAPEQSKPKPKQDNGVVQDMGEIIEEEGKRYRLVRNELGTVFRQDITGQVIPQNYRPLTGNALNIITEQQAIKHVDGFSNIAIHAAAGAIANLVGEQND